MKTLMLLSALTVFASPVAQARELNERFTLVIDDRNWILQQIKDLTNAQESRQELPWKVTDAPDDYIAAQLSAIIGIEIRIEKIEGKFKASQNHPEDNRKGVVEGFSKEGNEAMADIVANGGISAKWKTLEGVLKLLSRRLGQPVSMRSCRLIG